MAWLMLTGFRGHTLMLQTVDNSMSEITGSVLTSHVFGFDLEKQKKKKQWKTSGANAHCTHRKQENPKDLPRLWFWPEKEKKEHCVCVCMWICWWVGRQTNNASHSTSIKYTKKKPGSKGNIPLLVILSPYDTVSCSSSSTTRCQWYSHYVGSNQCTSFCNSPLSLQEKPMWLYLTYEFSCVQYHASASTMIKDHKKTFTYHKCSATHTRTHASTHAYTHTRMCTHTEKSTATHT